jgi:hypothetical protein
MLNSVIHATQEAEIRRIMVQVILSKNHMTLSEKYLKHKTLSET